MTLRPFALLVAVSCLSVMGVGQSYTPVPSPTSGINVPINFGGSAFRGARGLRSRY